MFESIKKFNENYKLKREFNRLIYHHSNITEILGRHKNLKKYIPELKLITIIKNKLLYNPGNIKGTNEMQWVCIDEKTKILRINMISHQREINDCLLAIINPR
jgi:hypothetical protein